MYKTKVPNKLLNSHECEALVITCMDFRFWQETLTKFVKKNLGIETFDVITVPGACKTISAESTENPIRQYLLNVIALSKKLHHIRQVICINHGTCGAYGISDPQEELAVQTKDLKKTYAVLTDLFPELSFNMFFAQMNSTNSSQEGDGEIIYIEV